MIQHQTCIYVIIVFVSCETAFHCQIRLYYQTSYFFVVYFDYHNIHPIPKIKNHPSIYLFSGSMWSHSRNNLLQIDRYATQLTLWQQGLWSFQRGRGTKLERFLRKNQHTHRNIEFWINGELSKIEHRFNNEVT